MCLRMSILCRRNLHWTLCALFDVARLLFFCIQIFSLLTIHDHNQINNGPERIRVENRSSLHAHTQNFDDEILKIQFSTYSNLHKCGMWLKNICFVGIPYVVYTSTNRLADTYTHFTNSARHAASICTEDYRIDAKIQNSYNTKLRIHSWMKKKSEKKIILYFTGRKMTWYDAKWSM